MSEKYNLINEFITTQYAPEFFKNHESNLFVTFISGGAQETFKIGSDGWRSFIQAAARESGHIGIREEVMKALKDDMSSMAERSVIKKDCFLRVGRTPNKDVLIDLGGNPRHFCKITPENFTVESSSAVPFWTSKNQRDLPLPDKTDDSPLDLLNSFLNLEDPSDTLLILAYLVKALIPNSGAYPILCIDGVQGSAKSTTTRILKKLVDPTIPDLCSPPRTQDDLFVKAINGYLLAFDNLSGLTHEFADAFCRLSTGGGFSKRKLYTDGDEISYDLMRPVIFNGIDEISDRPDLLDRTLIIHMKVIDPSKRMPEETVWERFNLAYPRLLGALYALTSSVLKELPLVQTSHLPRMADFARIGIAMEKYLKLEPGEFLEVYRNNDEDKTEGVISHNGLALALKKGLEVNKEITGSPQEVFNKLDQYKNYQDRSFPYSPRGLTAGLKRLEPVLNRVNIEIIWQRRSAIGRKLTIKYKDGQIPLKPRTDLEIPF